MIVNGVDTSALTPHMPAQNFPETVKGRTVQIDADFLAYQVSYEREGEVTSLSDMQHNCSIAVEKFRRLAAAEFVHLHLTPGTSDKGSRYDVAIQKEYQGNRKDKPKPRYLHIMRDWMGKNFPATLHQFCEADDGMSSAQYKAIAEGNAKLSIIASKDKDLDMVPGLHLIWDTGEIVPTDVFGKIWEDHSKSSMKLKGLGQKFFWAQMLMGDTADNIQGLPRGFFDNGKSSLVGPAMTSMLLRDINSNKEAFQFVKGLYETTGQQKGYKHWKTGEDVPWQRVFVSEAQLLWMRKDTKNVNCVLNWFKEINA